MADKTLSREDILWDEHFAGYFAGESIPDKAVHLLRELGYPDGDDVLYRHIPRADPLSARLRRSAERP